MKLQTILVIDDSRVIHELLQVCLAGEYIEMRSAYDGESGVRMARLIRPDLILLDIDMPGLDGFGACGQIREDVLTMNIPIMFLSATDGVEQKVYGLDMGALDYITKPFNQAELLARLRVALRVKARMDSLGAARVNHFLADPGCDFKSLVAA